VTGRFRYVWLAVFVAMVFVAGVATGVLVGPRLFAPLARAPRPMMGPGLGPGAGPQGGLLMPGPLGDRLAEELQLDAAQREKLEAVLAGRRERLLGFNREARDRFEVEQQALRREIAEILRPEQRTRFEQWLERGPRRGQRRQGRPPI
jgi:Spy/CpxP family protein refolding chaperone